MTGHSLTAEAATVLQFRKVQGELKPFLHTPVWAFDGNGALVNFEGSFFLPSFHSTSPFLSSFLPSTALHPPQEVAPKGVLQEVVPLLRCPSLCSVCLDGAGWCGNPWLEVSFGVYYKTIITFSFFLWGMGE